MSKRVEINMDQLDQVAGGAIGFDADGHGTFTMKCQYSGNRYEAVKLEDIIKMAEYAATIPNTPEGEQQILDYALGQGYIHN